MGDKDREPFQLSFNRFLKVDFQGSRVTSDGGLLLVRELDERLGLGKLIEDHLTDTRQGENKKFPLADLVRQSVYSRLAGYEDLNDAVRVSADPTFRLIGSKKNWDRGGALTSRLQSFEIGMLAGDENLIGLMAINRELVAQAEAGGRPQSYRPDRGGRATGKQTGHCPLGTNRDGGHRFHERGRRHAEFLGTRDLQQRRTRRERKDVGRVDGLPCHAHGRRLLPAQR